MIRYNKILPPVNDPHDPPATPTTAPAQNLGVTTPQPPNVYARGVIKHMGVLTLALGLINIGRPILVAKDNTLWQWRQSGLKSEGSWIRVKKMAVSHKKFDFFLAKFKEIS